MCLLCPSLTSTHSPTLFHPLPPPRPPPPPPRQFPGSIMSTRCLLLKILPRYYLHRTSFLHLFTSFPPSSVSVLSPFLGYSFSLFPQLFIVFHFSHCFPLFTFIPRRIIPFLYFSLFLSHFFNPLILFFSPLVLRRLPSYLFPLCFFHPSRYFLDL